jgi:hypothetical protein
MSEFQGAYPPPEPPKSSSSKWIWIILLAVVLPMLACAGLCGGFIFMLRGTADKVQEVVREGVRSTPPFRIALERIQADPEVQERLGQPIQESFPSVFNYNDSTGGSNAEFRYSISGPQGTAEVHVVGEKIDDQWFYRTLDVSFEDGETIDLADVDIPIQLE